MRAVALCAEGPAFSVGLDLKQMTGLLIETEGSQAEHRQRFLTELTELQEAINSVADCPVPGTGTSPLGNQKNRIAPTFMLEVSSVPEVASSSLFCLLYSASNVKAGVRLW